MKRTREATEVFFASPYTEELPEFKQREYKVLTELPGKPFHHQEDIDHSILWNLLIDLYKKRCHLKSKSSLKHVRRPANAERKTWASIVNKKREFIASVIKQRPTATTKDICRITGTSFQTVKSVQADLFFQNSPSLFQYNNLKPEYQVEQLKTIVDNVQGTYNTVSDIKRKLPSFSKKLIRRSLRKTGLRWRQMVKRRKEPKEERHPARQVTEVISHLIQAMNSPRTTLLYVDEVHFPLVQTATHHWTVPALCEELVYNRRQVPDQKLSAIALCSLEGFVAVQIYLKDITADDFLYFIQSCLERVLPDQRVTILADNASWHTSSAVTSTKAGKYLFFNVKGLYQSNAIENAFSFVRSDFRKRPLFETAQEEAKYLAEMFFQPQNKKRFDGIHRNHLRSLMKLLLQYSPKLKNIRNIPEY